MFFFCLSISSSWHSILPLLSLEFPFLDVQKKYITHHKKILWRGRRQQKCYKDKITSVYDDVNSMGKKLEISNKKEWRLALSCLMVNIVYLPKGSFSSSSRYTYSYILYIKNEKKAMMRKYEKNIQSHPLTIVALIIHSSLVWHKVRTNLKKSKRRCLI